MEAIRKLRLQLQTGDASGASTDGDVFLGFGGREFSLDTTDDDFGTESSREYIFGDDANVRFDEYNDPRHPQLFLEKAMEQPVYIRFGPKGSEDNWLLRRAEVYVSDHIVPIWDSAGILGISPLGLWMGARRGERLDLPRHVDTAVIAQAQQVNVAVHLR